jgi:hypothetical protein
MKQCFRCNGSGEICNICGEAPGACECSNSEVENYNTEYGCQFGECDDCNGEQA